MQRRFRQVFTSVREHTLVSYAKMATAGGYCDLDLIVVKATSPDDLPLPDRYVHQLLKIFSISPSSYRNFAVSFTRRFGGTRCWRVALKCLVLLHRLLRSLPDNTAFKNELLWTRSNGFLSLYPCHFRDCSSSAYEDYTLFIRSYAQLLDEALDCLSVGTETEVQMPAEVDDDQAAPDKMKEIDTTLQLLAQVQSLTDRVMECRPNGAAAKNFVVQSAMKYIIRDSFLCYTTFRREIVVVLEHLTQMPYRSCIAAFGIYEKAAMQAKQLCEFYDWCKSSWLCGVYEYPFIDQIPQILIQALEAFLNGMWQLTDQSSSSTEHNSLTSTLEYPSSSNEDDRDNQTIVIRPEYFVSNNCSNDEENGTMEKSKKDRDDMEPLLHFDDEENVGWEVLLEASINSSCMVSKNFFFFPPSGHGYGYGYGYGYGNNYSADVSRDEASGWQMQVYSPYTVNPFHQSHNMAAANYSSSSAYPWGL